MRVDETSENIYCMVLRLAAMIETIFHLSIFWPFWSNLGFLKVIFRALKLRHEIQYIYFDSILLSIIIINIIHHYPMYMFLLNFIILTFISKNAVQHKVYQARDDIQKRLGHQTM